MTDMTCIYPCESYHVKPSIFHIFGTRISHQVLFYQNVFFIFLQSRKQRTNLNFNSTARHHSVCAQPVRRPIQGGSKKVSCWHSTTAYFFEPPCRAAS